MDLRSNHSAASIAALRLRADLMDVVLAGRGAIVDAVEQDAESRVHLAVVIEDDPGRDLGELRQPARRFFYGLDEIEPLVGESEVDS
ncbi:MAG TPA: hypothetical protein VG710_02405 [Opitutus sp.]|nr:hypothetical protein [Opitutus sp.]